MNQFEVIQRGFDSSGRSLKNTRFKWAAFDRINGRMGGVLVIVQGAFRGSAGADASAGTHNEGGCNDVRRWNLTNTQADQVIDIANDIGEIWWERTTAQGFDPHFHNLLPNDRPLHPDAAAQVVYFGRGENGLASHGADTHSRPHPFPTFTFEEDDMFEDADRKKLDTLLQVVRTGFTNERTRDQAERERELARHRSLAAFMESTADQIGNALNMLKDDESPTAKDVKRLLRNHKVQLLKALKDDPTTTDTPADPSDDAIDDAVEAAKS